MSVKQQADGRRSVEVAFEVPGTPQEVWDAIATGPGLSSWFMPTRFEVSDGRPVALMVNFAPGAEPTSRITAWDPPRMYRGEGEVYGGSPPVATEWHVQARAGGVCQVRMVHSLFASTEEWDNQLEGAAGGWAGFINNLRLYMQYFRGQHGAIMQVHVPVAMDEAAAWNALTSALGVKGVGIGLAWRAPADAPALAGVVEAATEDPFDALIRLDTPRAGIAALGTYTFPGRSTMVAMNLYLYGEGAAESVAQLTPVWEAWFTQRFR